MPKYVLDPDDLVDYIDAESSRLQEQSERLLREGIDLLADVKKTKRVLDRTMPELPEEVYRR